VCRISVQAAATEARQYHHSDKCKPFIDTGWQGAIGKLGRSRQRLCSCCQFHDLNYEELKAEFLLQLYEAILLFCHVCSSAGYSNEA
jgi:hypothetical protein